MEGENVWRVQQQQGSAKTYTDAEGPIVGIDFGTSNSCLAVWHHGKQRAKVVRNVATQQRTTPSTVAFDRDAVVVGVQPEHTALHVVEAMKLLLGAERGDAGAAARTDCAFDSSGQLCLRDLAASDPSAPSALTVEAAAAQVIASLKSSAEAYYRRRPAAWLADPTTSAQQPAWDGVLRRCVVGVPASYTERRKGATRRAAELAGFTDVHLMVESTAAAMAYGLLTAGTKEVLVVDMGCGTLDCTALGVADGACTVRATAGAVGCGGRHIDELLLGHALAAMGVVVTPVDAEARRPATSIDVLEPARGKLLAVCRVCKEAFSSLPEEEGEDVEVVFPTATFLTLGAAAAARFAVAQRSFCLATTYTPLTDTSIPTALRCAVSPRAFDALCAPVAAVVEGTVRRTVQQWRAAVASTSKSSSSVDEVVLVGGSSRARPVRRAVRRALVAEGFAAFHRPEAYVYCPDDVAAAAAAAAAARAIALPVTVAGVSTADTEAPGEFCTSVDADEAVALGLAARGAVLGGRVGEGRLRDLLMMDALPTSIGVLCWDAASADAAPALVGTSGMVTAAAAGRGERIFEPVLCKGARLPCAARRAFTVAAAARPGAPRLVSLDVYEEVEEWSTDDGSGGGGLVYTYQLMGTYDYPIPEAAVVTATGAEAGAAVVDVVFAMSADGALTIAVEAPADTAGTHSTAAGGASAQERAMFRVLALYLAALAVMYFAAKALLRVPDYPNAS